MILELQLSMFCATHPIVKWENNTTAPPRWRRDWIDVIWVITTLMTLSKVLRWFKALQMTGCVITSLKLSQLLWTAHVQWMDSNKHGCLQNGMINSPCYSVVLYSGSFLVYTGSFIVCISRFVIDISSSIICIGRFIVYIGSPYITNCSC